MSEQEQAELRAGIERTRTDLGATVEALAQKADIKSQAQAKTRELQQRLPEQARERPVLAIAAGIGVILVARRLLRRR